MTESDRRTDAARTALGRVGLGAMLEGLALLTGGVVAASIDTSQRIRSTYTMGVIALFGVLSLATVLARTGGAWLEAMGTNRMLALAPRDEAGPARGLAKLAWLRLVIPIGTAFFARFVYKHGGPIGLVAALVTFAGDVLVAYVALRAASLLRFVPWTSGRMLVALIAITSALPAIASLVTGSSSGPATGATAILHGAATVFVGFLLRRYARS